MNRRLFVKNSGALAAISLIPNPFMAMGKKPAYKMGYQLFSVRDEMAQNPIATLNALKAMGFRDFELYGYNNEKNTFYDLAVADFAMVLKDLNVTVSSGHYGFSPYLEKTVDELFYFTDQCIEAAQAINSKYITWPWIAPEQRTIEKFKLMSHKLNMIGEHVTKANLGFAYHNHGFEFEDHNGENGFEIILKETDPSLVKLQMDMYWVMHSSKHTPQDLINEQPGRYVMWHIKDMHRESRDYTELGNGSINYPELLPDPVKSGLEYYYIEQGGNFSVSSLKSAEESATYFNKHLRHRL